MSGPVHPCGMGDLLQYLVALALVRKNLPDADMVFSTMGHSLGFLRCLTNATVVPSLAELSSAGHLAKSILGTSSVSSGRSGETVEARGLSGTIVRTMVRTIAEKYYESEFSILYVRPAISRVLLKDEFNAGVIGGHTVEESNFFGYMIDYVVSNALVRGPTITFPISISQMGSAILRHSRLLRRALGRLDVIFVRGPYSYQIMRQYVDEDRIRIAPDSGFGISFLESERKRKKRTSNTTVAIVPRKDCFYVYGNPKLYEVYQSVLIKTIRWLIQQVGATVYLVPHLLRHEIVQGLDDESAIEDLKDALRDHGIGAHLHVFRPTSPMETYRLFSSVNLVITSRMHAGIAAMSSGSPALFLLPRGDTKIQDILSTLRLDPTDFFVDIFGSGELDYENLRHKVRRLLDRGDELRSVVAMSVKRILPDVELPARVLAQAIV